MNCINTYREQHYVQTIIFTRIGNTSVSMVCILSVITFRYIYECLGVHDAKRLAAAPPPIDLIKLLSCLPLILLCIQNIAAILKVIFKNRIGRNTTYRIGMNCMYIAHCTYVLRMYESLGHRCSAFESTGLNNNSWVNPALAGEEASPPPPPGGLWLYLINGTRCRYQTPNTFRSINLAYCLQKLKWPSHLNIRLELR